MCEDRRAFHLVSPHAGWKVSLAGILYLVFLAPGFLTPGSLETTYTGSAPPTGRERVQVSADRWLWRAPPRR